MFELRIEITLQLRFIFGRHCDVFVIYLFNIVTFFDKVRITLYFGTFKLRFGITLQLRYVSVRHCDVILLRHNDVVLLRLNYVIYLFDLYVSTFEICTETTL